MLGVRAGGGNVVEVGAGESSTADEAAPLEELANASRCRVAVAHRVGLNAWPRADDLARPRARKRKLVLAM